MEKGSKIILALAVGLGAYYWFYMRKPADAATDTGSDTGAGAGAGANSVEFPNGVGSSGATNAGVSVTTSSSPAINPLAPRPRGGVHTTPTAPVFNSGEFYPNDSPFQHHTATINEPAIMETFC